MRRLTKTGTSARRLLVSAIALLWVPALLLAQGVEPEHIVAMEAVGQVVLSPDGGTIAYTLTKPRTADERYGRSYSELWMMPASGGEPQLIVGAPRSARSPQWSPNGELLAFTAQLDGHDRTQVYAVPGGGGDVRLLTDVPSGVLSFAWSPDGEAVAYTTRVPLPEDVVRRRARGDDVEVGSEGPQPVRLWVTTLSTGAQRAVTSPERTVRSFAWMPDASGFAVQLTESADVDAGYMDRRIFTIDEDGEHPRLLTKTDGKLGGMAWSPDGAWLAYVGAVSRNDPLAQSLFVVPREGGMSVNRTATYEGSVTSVGWFDDETVTFLADEGTRTTWNRIGVEGGAIERVLGGGREILSAPSVDARGRTFALGAHTAQHPREVFVGTVRRGTLERRTHHNSWLDDIQLARQETIEWKGADGWRIEGVLVYPLAAASGVRSPLVILPHGGPEGISLDGWTTRALYPAQLLAAQGYAVLMPNYRGSAGRGVAFSKGDHRDLGGKEFLDVLAGIEHLAGMGLIDPDRVGMSGTSYGGYFSALAATKYSEHFRAAIPYAGISNWMSFTGTTDIPYEMSIVHWDTWWFDDPGLSWDRSPLAHVNQAATATLVGHGLADTRVDPGQSVELYTALRIKGVPSDLLLYPREPHGLTERAHQLDFMRRTLAWFDRYLKSSVATTSP
jgi:dipeptidyl aminopeptidase/acylaminoacyl peptidase